MNPDIHFLEEMLKFLLHPTWKNESYRLLQFSITSDASMSLATRGGIGSGTLRRAGQDPFPCVLCERLPN